MPAVALILIALISASVAAQPTCGVVTSISYPVDTNTFQLVQDYAAASPRHQGRMHTGEDWAAGPRATRGQPVRAAAAGRVTYSSPIGWGRDGGVVIIEHTLRDDTIFYTQYGHMEENDMHSFPARLSCVEAGQVIGVIGDTRPAPHLHFEVRVNNPDIAGPGYTREHPNTLGWRRPAQWITNIGARLHPAYAWHTTITEYAVHVPPFVLSDQSLLVARDNVLRRVTLDGRILWRVTLDQPVAALSGFAGRPLIHYVDGRVGHVDYDGSLGDSWRVSGLDSLLAARGALNVGGNMIFYTADGALAALGADRREILWRRDEIPAFNVAHVGASLVGLGTPDELLLLNRDGEVIDRAELRSGVSLATGRDGVLLAFTHGGLWRIDAAGNWSEAIPAENLPNGGGAGAVTSSEDGRIFLTNGERFYAFSRSGQPAWEARLPRTVEGRAQLDYYAGVILLTSSDGHIMTIRDGGGICAYTQLYGSGWGHFWHELGADGTLRVAVGDQLLGLDWRRFTAGC